MVGRARQRGSLTVIVVILIVVVAMLATTITFLFVEDERATVDYLEASSALFVAESGVEKGIRALSLNATYAGEGPTSFGAGTFTITISNTDVFGAALPSSDRRVTSKGVVQGTARTLEVTVRLGGILFQDPFPNITQWGVAVSNTIATCPVGNIGLFSTGGTVSYDVDNATGSTGGSFEVEMIPRNKRRTGSQRVTLASTIAAGSPVTVELNFKKIVGARVPDVMMLAIDLVSTANDVNRVWSDCGKATTAAGWVTVAPVAFTVPAGQTIDRIAIAYDLDSSNINPAATFTARVDDVKLTSTTATSILSWRENTH